MNPQPFANATSGFLWGDYEGLTAHGYNFYGAFTGRSIGRTPAQLDPIFFKRSAFKKPWPPVINICALQPSLCQLAEIDKNVIKLNCHMRGCIIIDPVPRNCLYKYACPGCSPAGKCPPPFYIMQFTDPAQAWDIKLLDPLGNMVKTDISRSDSVVTLSFAPKAEFVPNGKIGNYQLVFTMNNKGVIGKEYSVHTTLVASDVPFSRPEH